MQPTRLNKFIAHAGIASRREADKLILQGKITVNGKTQLNPATKISPDNDVVVFNDKKITIAKKLLFALNKPLGIISTASDEQGRENVTDLIPTKERLYPIGRLDKDSEGLILLTNDGELAYKLSHPKFNVSKKYLVFTKSQKIPPTRLVKKLLEPKKLDGKLKTFDMVEFQGREDGLLKFEVTLHEGVNRHIRRIFGMTNLPVQRLKRVQYGDIELGNLKTGEYKEINDF